MRSDFTGDTIKDNIRLGHIAEATRMPYLWDAKQDRLRCDWLELCGEQAPTARHLLDFGVLKPPQKFIGWDLDSEVISRCNQTYQTEVSEGSALFRSGDLISALRVKDPVLEDVGVLVWDQTKAASEEFTEHLFPSLAKFANQQRERLGEFLLILAVSDPPMGETGLRMSLLRRLGEAIGNAFGSKPVPPENLLRYRGDTSAMSMNVLRIRLL